MTDRISLAAATRADLAALDRILASLEPEDWAVLPFVHDIWLRPNQRIPVHNWRTCTMIAGRGFGKTHPIAAYINDGIASGEITSLALIGPTEKRVHEVQIKMLIDLSPPWFRPTPHLGGLVWPNGVRAVVFTAEAPDRMRGESVDVSWCSEIVDWPHTSRDETWNNALTITRTGIEKVFADTTSLGKNSVILRIEADHNADPEAHVLMRGTTFDNPYLTPKYLKSTCAGYVIGSQRFKEEILGMIFAESQGALWRQKWINDYRVAFPPSDPEIIAIGLDPALSDRPDADETGIVVAARKGRDVYLLRDLSGRYRPEQYGDIIVDQCERHGAAGFVVEHNRVGLHPESIVRARANTRGIDVHRVEPDKPMPRRTAGKIYVKYVVAATSKTSRAEGPAAETEAGRVHVVGTLPELEHELTTFEPGGPSPNRYDAAVYAITELRDLMRERERTAAAEDVANAVNVARELNVRLAQAHRMQRVGL